MKYVHIHKTYVWYRVLYNIQNIHTYARSILFNRNLNLNPRNLRKEKHNPNLRNPGKELKSFVKPQEDIECCLER